ncbi:MAG: hypothetical protein HYZ28_15950 [Myxococcales bacterium]|nr:hypothetical protein [Myxococcales bacterium]
MSVRAALLSMVVLLVGCRDFQAAWKDCVADGRCAEVREDGGTVGGEDGGTDPSALRVTGRRYSHYQLVDGGYSRPADLRSVELEVLVPLDGGGFLRLPAAGEADGGFYVDGVPTDATYTLSYGRVVLVATSGRFVDVSDWRLGRHDAVWPAVFTPAVLKVSGLEPWQSQDQLWLVSLRAGALVSTAGKITGPMPDAGDTSVDGLAFDFHANGQPLISSAQGDEATLYQLASLDSDAGYGLLVADRAIRVKSLEMVSGQAATISGAMSPIPREKSATFDWRASELESQVLGSQPGSIFFLSFLTVYALPGAYSAGAYAGGADLARAYRLAPGSTNPQPSFSYGNPFEGTDELVMSATVAFRGYQADGATSPGFVLVTNFAQQKLDVGKTVPVRPLVAAPTGLRINGKDLNARQTNVTLTPVISWSPPAPPPPFHTLTLYRIANIGNATEITQQAIFHVYGNSVQVPPGILQAGGKYFAIIASVAVQQGPTLEPFRRLLPTGWASVSSEVFEP